MFLFLYFFLFHSKHFFSLFPFSFPFYLFFFLSFKIFSKKQKRKALRDRERTLRGRRNQVQISYLSSSSSSLFLRKIEFRGHLVKLPYIFIFISVKKYIPNKTIFFSSISFYSISNNFFFHFSLSLFLFLSISFFLSFNFFMYTKRALNIYIFVMNIKLNDCSDDLI